ncbi:serine hydrolase [Streptomyces sp. NPDC050504]|uniref:serine hydrolase n=1 Tax=Streptomyces sp. NPDC050504 TaxID=3365618 RepID=UPI0037AA2E5F
MGIRISVATDGFSYGDGEAFSSASVVKVGIALALALRGRPPDAGERALVDAMIRRSDNDAASALYAVVGGPAGLDAAHARLGLRETVADRAWGLTRTTARDQLTVVRSVFAGHPGVARAMARVVDGQRWGVSAAGGPYALKNGWMPMRATGLWVVHSVGVVRGRAVAVLSDGHATLAEGIARVEAAAREAVGEG